MGVMMSSSTPEQPKRTQTRDAKEPSGVENDWLKVYGDGTIGTKRVVRRLDNPKRIAIAHRFAGKRVELIVRPSYGGEVIAYGVVMCAGWMHNGGAGVVMLQQPGHVVPDGYSLATVEHITELSEDEWNRVTLS